MNTLRRAPRRRSLALALAVLPWTAGAPDDLRGARRAEPLPDIDVARCVEVARLGSPAGASACPGFLVDALAGALRTCVDVGGTLVAASPPSLWSIDLGGDGTPAVAFEIGDVVDCDGAPSVFSCGSLGCPLGLYEQRDARWHPIGAVDAGAPEAIEVLPGAAASGHPDLRVGCRDDPCAEYSYYRWTGEAYERARLQVRGHWVDFAGSVHGLRSLVGETAVLATPAPDGRVIERYEAGTEVAIVGQAETAPYFYVSPCNACESGFVEKSSLRDP